MPWLTGILRIQNTGALSLRLTLCASFLLGLVTDSKCVAAKHRKTIIDHSIPRFRALTPEDSHMSAIKLNEEQQQAVERCDSPSQLSRLYFAPEYKRLQPLTISYAFLRFNQSLLL